MIRASYTAQTVIDRIYEVHGSNRRRRSVTQIINQMRRDPSNGGNATRSEDWRKSSSLYLVATLSDVKVNRNLDVRLVARVLALSCDLNKFVVLMNYLMVTYVCVMLCVIGL
jgi:hypothetical protein